jgi:hypothetical protein
MQRDDFASGRQKLIGMPMSAFGPKQTWPSALHMSAFGGKADQGFLHPLLTQADIVGAKSKDMWTMVQLQRSAGWV